ncbi:hypothetical protein U9M48_027797 [Paspalum notatum var. saurae]|uniref:DUF295 domain-containing protein n=1 Tax=Paspalum notatum var. saurae TaxID=547442 RepID=A0AAQ3WZW3_PASNO
MAVVASVLTTCPGSSSTGGVAVNPLVPTSGVPASPLPPLSSFANTRWWVDRAVGTVCGDGTILMYLIGASHPIAVLPTFDPWANWCILDTRLIDDDTGDQRSLSMHAPYYHSCHFLESRGELLTVFLRAEHRDDINDRYSVGNFTVGLQLSVYALMQREDGNPEWMKKDGQSLADRVVFLGWPSNFAVDAARLGMSGAGCAYFVVKSELYGGIWSKSTLKWCRLFKYNFIDSKSELVEQLLAEWRDVACMWVTPQPSFASTEGSSK